MPTELAFGPQLLLSFLLALARVGGVIAFMPFPGLRNGPEPARVVFALLITWCLRGVWPHVNEMPGPALITLWIVGEAAFGTMLGLLVSFLLEAFQFGAQVLSVQAGYSYASTIDPTTQADSGVIPIAIQLMTGFCFFASGVDRELLRAMARTFERFPPGGLPGNESTVQAVVQGGSAMVVTGVQMALPVIAFLLLVDVALALLGRLQSQLQLLSLAFPAKMLVSLALLASLAVIYPSLFESAAKKTLQGVARLLGG